MIKENADATIAVKKTGSSSGAKSSSSNETVQIRPAAKSTVKTASRTLTRSAAKPAAKAVDSLVGKDIGKYRIKKELGKGGMGAVYIASHPNLKKEVVLKKLILKRNHTSARDRFKHEAQVLMELSNSYVVRMFDYFSEGGSDYIVLEYVNGMALDKLLEKVYSLPVPLALVIFLDVCYGLKSAHQKGIIHRDIKPANILISKKAEVKLADFGIAGDEKSEEEETAGPASAPSDQTVISVSSKKDSLTQSGTSLGTPAYMSPEQLVDASSVDKRSDIYSMGVMLYQMLTGDRPYKGDMSLETQERIKKGIYIAPRKLDKTIPRSIEALIKKMMKADRNKRYDNIDKVIKKVKAYLNRYDKLTKHEIREYLARLVLDMKVKQPVWVPRFRTLKRVCSVVFIVGAVAYAWVAGYFHLTVLRPFFVPVKMTLQIPQIPASGKNYSSELPAKAFFFVNDNNEIPEVDFFNKTRVFIQDKKTANNDKLLLSTKNVYLRPGEYRIKIATGPYIWWKSVTVNKGKAVVMDLDFFKDEQRTLNIQGHAYDHDTGDDITENASFQLLVDGKWTPLSKVKSSFLSTGKVVHVRVSCDGYESESFGLSTGWYQDTLFVNASLKKKE